jgi:thiol-disulfide isomerase/thioredoxin
LLRTAFLILLAGLLSLDPAFAAKLGPGAAAPQFVRGDIQGHTVDLKALRGKFVLLDFWATWCAPCVLAIPHLIDMQKRDGAKLQIIGISMDDSLAPVTAAATRFAFNYPVLLGDAKFGTLYGGILGLPVEMLVGPDGKLVSVWRDDPSPAVLEKAVQAALNQKP